MAKAEEGKFDAFAPENVAPLVAFLASDEAADVNGQNFVVYGGSVWVMQGWQPAGELKRDCGVDAQGAGRQQGDALRHPHVGPAALQLLLDLPDPPVSVDSSGSRSCHRLSERRQPAARRPGTSLTRMSGTAPEIRLTSGSPRGAAHRSRGGPHDARSVLTSDTVGPGRICGAGGRRRTAAGGRGRAVAVTGAGPERRAAPARARRRPRRRSTPPRPQAAIDDDPTTRSSTCRTTRTIPAKVAVIQDGLGHQGRLSRRRRLVGGELGAQGAKIDSVTILSAAQCTKAQSLPYAVRERHLRHPRHGRYGHPAQQQRATPCSSNGKWLVAKITICTPARPLLQRPRARPGRPRAADGVERTVRSTVPVPRHRR